MIIPSISFRRPHVVGRFLRWIVGFRAGARGPNGVQHRMDLCVGHKLGQKLLAEQKLSSIEALGIV